MDELALINDRYESILSRHGPIGVEVLRLLTFMRDRNAYVVKEPFTHGKVYLMDVGTRERVRTDGFRGIRNLLEDVISHSFVRSLSPQEHGLPETKRIISDYPRVYAISDRGRLVLDETRDKLSACLARREARPKLLVITARSRLPTGELSGIGCLCEVVDVAARSYIVRVVDRIGNAKDSERLLTRHSGSRTAPKSHVLRYGATREEWDRLKPIEERRLAALAGLDAYYGLKIATLQQEWDHLAKEENGKAEGLIWEVLGDNAPRPQIPGLSSVDDDSQALTTSASSKDVV